MLTPKSCDQSQSTQTRGPRVELRMNDGCRMARKSINVMPQVPLDVGQPPARPPTLPGVLEAPSWSSSANALFQGEANVAPSQWLLSAPLLSPGSSPPLRSTPQSRATAPTKTPVFAARLPVKRFKRRPFLHLKTMRGLPTCQPTCITRQSWTLKPVHRPHTPFHLPSSPFRRRPMSRPRLRCH